MESGFTEIAWRCVSGMLTGKSLSIVIIVNKEGKPVVVCAGTSDSAQRRILAYNEENKFAMKCNALFSKGVMSPGY